MSRKEKTESTEAEENTHEKKLYYKVEIERKKLTFRKMIISIMISKLIKKKNRSKIFGITWYGISFVFDSRKKLHKIENEKKYILSKY